MTQYFIVQFQAGPPGASGGYTTPNPPILYNATATGAFVGAEQKWGLDTSTSAFNLTVPSAVFGQVMQVDDHRATWASKPPSLIMPAGVTIENPMGGGYVSALTLRSYGGTATSSYRWTFYVFNNGESNVQLWKLT